ncbi:MAG: ATP-binding protein [Bacteroidales bacterium]|nr:ATP-binding protein [Bacteroidales bacterium]
MKSERGEILKKKKLYLLIILILSVSVAVVVYYTAASKMRDRIVDEYIKTKTNKLSKEFKGRMQSYENTIRLFSKWGQNGLINLDDTASFERAFIPILSDVKSIYGITIIENTGKEYEIIKKDSLFLSDFYFPRKKLSLIKYIDRQGNVIKNQKVNQSKSVSEKYWLKKSKVDTDFIWQGPYVSKLFNQEVISISSSWINKDSSTVHIAIHFLLKDVFRTFTKIDLSDDEYIFLLNDYGDIYDIPGINNFTDTEYSAYSSLNPFYRIKLPEVAKAVEMWLDNQKDTVNTVAFKIKRNNYWAKFKFLNKQKPFYLMGIVVSEKSINSKIGKNNIQILLLSTIILLAGALLMVLVIIRSNRRLRELQKTEIRENFIKEDIKKLARLPEGKTLEFKSTIRYNLHTEKNDKAIEFAWIKGVAAFLNTEGGVLLIGVNDDGEFTGIEKDGFENEDKALLHIKNLVSKNIGVEYMKFITMFTAVIEEKTIIALVCKQSSKPAYMKNGGEEQFYVRVGPSSTKLSITQTVEHIFTHGYKQIVTLH